MKNLLILLFTLGAVFPQQITELNGVATVSLPANAKLLPKKSGAQGAAKQSGGEMQYKIGDCILKLRAMAGDKSDLTEIKEGLDAFGKEAPDYFSELRKINNYEVLITYGETADKGKYQFFSTATAGGQVAGILEFPTLKKAEGAALLEHVLKGMRYKERK